MNDDVNRSSVIASFWNVDRRMIADEFQITFYNQRARDPSQRFVVKSTGNPVPLEDVPAFPFGLAEVFISPSKYRYKSIFVNVPAGTPGNIEVLLSPGEGRRQTRFLTRSENSRCNSIKVVAGSDSALKQAQLTDLTPETSA